MATDKQMLTSILNVEKLTPGEKRAFQAMYDDLMNGKIIGLSKMQRLWAGQLYAKYNLDKVRGPNKPVAVKDKGAPLALDTMPKPLKPPGR